MSLARSELTHAEWPALWVEPDAALIDGLRQRVRLLETILGDLTGPQTILHRNLVPARLVAEMLLAGTTRSVNPRLTVYSAELVLCPDEVWRVGSDHLRNIGNHPAAQLLEAPALAGFLPQLCRSLLRQPLAVPSLPSRWLADPGALQEIAASLPRWAIIDACRRAGPMTPLGKLTPDQRSLLQCRVDAEPWRWAARMLVDGQTARLTLARDEAGEWAESDG